MWTRSAANKETGKFAVTCTDFHGEVCFTGEFDTVEEADRAGEAAERRIVRWEESGRWQPTQDELDARFAEISDDELLSELVGDGQ